MAVTGGGGKCYPQKLWKAASLQKTTQAVDNFVTNSLPCP
jgi:hypothetical protein